MSRKLMTLRATALRYADDTCPHLPRIEPCDACLTPWIAALREVVERCVEIAKKNDYCQDCETANHIVAALRREFVE